MESIPVRQLHSFNNEPELVSGFSLRSLETLMNGSDLEQPLHRHDFYFVLILQNGSGIHEIDFKSFSIKPNSVFFMRPGQVHRLHLNAKSSGYLLQFDAAFYHPEHKTSKSLLRKVGRTNLFQFNTESFVKIEETLSRMLEEFDQKKENHELSIKAYLEVLLVELSRKDVTQTETPENLYKNERLDELFSLLEKHVANKKQVSQYAEMMNLSSYQINAISKSTLGKTCSALINEQIILEAKRLLLATQSQVSEIAYTLGYEDASYFARFFKKQVGISPETFRNNFN